MAESNKPITEASLTRRLWELTKTFFLFGSITFGGGYAIVALLEEKLVHEKQWMTADELLQIITIGESTPGPIAVNTATFVGYRLAGIPGGIIATLALVFPAWLIIFLLSSCYVAFRDNVWIAAAMAGIRIAAIVLIVRAFVRMGQKLAPTNINILMGIVAFLLYFSGVSAILILSAALLFGVLWYGILKGGRNT